MQSQKVYLIFEERRKNTCHRHATGMLIYVASSLFMCTLVLNVNYTTEKFNVFDCNDLSCVSLMNDFLYLSYYIDAFPNIIAYFYCSPCYWPKFAFSTSINVIKWYRYMQMRGVLIHFCNETAESQKVISGKSEERWGYCCVCRVAELFVKFLWTI